MEMNLLPVTIDDMRERGWQELDVILITGDAYVDHPSFGAAVIGTGPGGTRLPGRHYCPA